MAREYKRVQRELQEKVCIFSISNYILFFQSGPDSQLQTDAEIAAEIKAQEQAELAAKLKAAQDAENAAKALA